MIGLQLTFHLVSIMFVDLGIRRSSRESNASFVQLYARPGEHGGIDITLRDTILKRIWN